MIKFAIIKSLRANPLEKMNINIKATNIQLTPAIKEYIEKKLSSIDHKLINPNDTSAICDVEVGKISKHHQKRDVFRAEFNLNIAGKFYRAVATQRNLYAAIDEAQDELFRMLRSSKKKRTDITRRGMLKIKNLIRGLKW